jgi:GTP cyclohydrolase IA
LDKVRAEQAVRDLLLALGQDLSREGLKDTPRRVAEMYMAQIEGDSYNSDWQRTFSEEKFDELILVRDMPFVSVCEHHMVFYSGLAHVGYIAREKLLGVSKLARLVYDCSKGLTVQERVTKSVADQLYAAVEPMGCMVVLEATHGCMSLRGARAIGSSTVTSAVRGVFRDVPAARSEMMALVSRGGRR